MINNNNIFFGQFIHFYSHVQLKMCGERSDEGRGGYNN